MMGIPVPSKKNKSNKVGIAPVRDRLSTIRPERKETEVLSNVNHGTDVFNPFRSTIRKQTLTKSKKTQSSESIKKEIGMLESLDSLVKPIEAIRQDNFSSNKTNSFNNLKRKNQPSSSDIVSNSQSEIN